VVVVDDDCMLINSHTLACLLMQGRAQRDGSMNDLGSVHERAAAIFTLHLAQASITTTVSLK
jgi:hypothetical protein